jgi:hypothetical protein
MTIKNLDWVRSVPVIGSRLYESLLSVQNGVSNIESQTNTSAHTQPDPPPAINSLKVSTGPGGEFQAAITDQGNVNRGVNYWLEHADNPQFNNPHHIDLGGSRNWSGHMGNQKLYWRAYSSYQSSPASPAVYHGSQASPAPVTGGVVGGRAPSQGAGTGAPGQGLYGPGPVASRGPTSGFDQKAQG